MSNTQIFRMPQWYAKFRKDCFPTVFVSLSADELAAMRAAEKDTDVVQQLIPRLQEAMNTFPGGRFLSMDTVAPTDTERFLLKRGSIHSAKSGWKILCSSKKIQAAVAAGEAETICIRPFRHMQPAREFRLFIKDGKLVGMSQYWLIRHFRRLPDRLERYWKKANGFVERIKDDLPASTIVADIYFKGSGGILLIDFNPWGGSTNPLMYNTWDYDWSQPGACTIVPAPRSISGQIEVHF